MSQVSFIAVSMMLSTLLLTACSTEPYKAGKRVGAKLAPNTRAMDDEEHPLYQHSSSAPVSLKKNSDVKFATDDHIDTFIKDTAYIGHPSYVDEDAICYDYGHMIRHCAFRILPPGNTRDAANGPIPRVRNRRDLQGYAVITERYGLTRPDPSVIFPLRKPVYEE